MANGDLTIFFHFSDSNLRGGHSRLHARRKLPLHRNGIDGIDDVAALHRRVDADERHRHQGQDRDACLRRQKRRESGGKFLDLRRTGAKFPPPPPPF